MNLGNELSDVWPAPEYPNKVKLLKFHIGITGGCLGLAAIDCAEQEEEIQDFGASLLPAFALVSPFSKSVAFSLQIVHFLLGFLFALKSQDFHYHIE